MARKSLKSNAPVKQPAEGSPAAGADPAAPPSPPPAGASGKKTYRAREAVRHDGRYYAPGKEIDLTDDQARPLLAAGVIA